MFGTIVLALTIPEALQSGSVQFATVYATLRLVIVGLYFQAWRLVPQSRELARRYTLSFSIALVLWLVSIILPPPIRFILWGLALLIEISNGPVQLPMRRFAQCLHKFLIWMSGLVYS